MVVKMIFVVSGDICLGRNLYVCEGVAVAAVMWKS